MIQNTDIIEEAKKPRGKDGELAPDVIKIGRVVPEAGPSGMVITREGLVVVVPQVTNSGISQASFPAVCLPTVVGYWSCSRSASFSS